MKTQSQTQLPRFIVGALATASASAASAATVQITFANNYVANTANGGLTNFNGDLTGDLVADIVGGADNGYAKIWVAQQSGVVGLGSGRVSGSYFIIGNGGGFSATASGGAQVSKRRIVSYSFTDGRMNGGLQTNGWLDRTATSGPEGQVVRIHRLIFDDADFNVPAGVTASDAAYPEWNAVPAVPEPSSLGLLALGAGGLLARRRREKTAV